MLLVLMSHLMLKSLLRLVLSIWVLWSFNLFLSKRWRKVEKVNWYCSGSVQFSHSVVADSLWPHGLEHTRPPCPSPTPGVYSSSCPLSQWCHPTISYSVDPFSSCLQSFTSSLSFQWVSSLHQVVKVLEFQLQHQSFQWIFWTDFPQGWPAWSPCSSRDS